MDDLRYPIGQFHCEDAIPWGQVQAWIVELAQCPAALRQAVAGLSAEQLDTPYRPAGWTVRQVVHHLPDARLGPVDVSLALLESVHQRWDLLLRAMTPQEFARSFQHPTRGLMTLDRALGIYAWHGRHHVAHITALRSRMRW